MAAPAGTLLEPLLVGAVTRRPDAVKGLPDNDSVYRGMRVSVWRRMWPLDDRPLLDLPGTGGFDVKGRRDLVGTHCLRCSAPLGEKGRVVKTCPSCGLLNTPALRARYRRLRAARRFVARIGITVLVMLGVGTALLVAAHFELLWLCPVLVAGGVGLWLSASRTLPLLRLCLAFVAAAGFFLAELLAAVQGLMWHAAAFALGAILCLGIGQHSVWLRRAEANGPRSSVGTSPPPPCLDGEGDGSE